MKVLAGDIGGTRSRLALYDGTDRLAEQTYPSRDYADLESVVQKFIGETNAKAEYACFAIAGPVRDGVCVTTNLPWQVDERKVAQKLGLSKVRLINDFAAQAVGVTLLQPNDYCELLEGTPDNRSPIAVIGAGTGLGQAYVLIDSDGKPQVLPGEGGHADFAPCDERQCAILKELWKLLNNRVSYELVLSGRGLHNLYRGLRAAGIAQESPEIAEEITKSDPAAVISKAALSAKDNLCKQALEVFVEIYAQEAANMALRTLAQGGVYLAGGIAPKILPALQTERFRERFRQKPPHVEVLKSIPVRVVLDTSLGLRGAAQIARNL